MIHSMHITAENQPAMMERILQTTRVRGFHILSMEAHASDERHQLRITLTVQSERADERLTRQLEKISGVLSLTALHSVDNEAARIRASA
jgi:acetolactate synthase II small subunit